MPVNISTTAEALNRYHIRYDRTIHTTLKKGIELENLLRPVSCKHTYTAASVEIESVLQAYQCAFTPNLSGEFDAIDNPLQRLKIDIQFTCDDLDQFWDTWMCEWVEEGKPLATWTFPRWIYENHIIPKIFEDIDFASFWGVREEPVAGVAGTPDKSVDGIRIKIERAQTAGLVVPIPTGVLNTDTVNKVETFADNLPIRYRNLPGAFVMSSTNSRKYWRDYRGHFGTGNGVNNNENNELRIDGTRQRIKGVGTMEGSEGLLFIPDNLNTAIHGRRTGTPYLPPIKWQVFERTIKGLMEFSKLYGFKYWGHTFINDQF